MDPNNKNIQRRRYQNRMAQRRFRSKSRNLIKAGRGGKQTDSDI
jgi:hypothetical protein